MAHAVAAQHAPAPAPVNDETLGGVKSASRPAVGVAGSDPSRDGGGGMGVARALQGVGVVLDETWDTAESPNFAAALQARENPALCAPRYVALTSLGYARMVLIVHIFLVKVCVFNFFE